MQLAEPQRPATLDEGSGPPVLLLHGQPGRASHWAPVVRILREQARAIVPDRPGYGPGAEPAGGLFFNAEASVALLDSLEVDSAVVAGHSWGCGVAMAMAARFPERVRGLVLVGSLVPRAKPAAIDRLFANRRFGPAAIRAGFLAGGSALSLRLVRRQARRWMPRLPDSELRTAAAEWRGDRVWRSFYAEQRAWVEEAGTLASELESITATATILSGRWDLVSPPRQVLALSRAMPRSAVIEVRSGGHLLPLQRPRLVAGAIAAAARVPRAPQPPGTAASDSQR